MNGVITQRWIQKIGQLNLSLMQMPVDQSWNIQANIIESTFITSWLIVSADCDGRSNIISTQNLIYIIDYKCW